jgi:hypothetical protein
MIKNFDEIKKQLADLTEVINGYKSEAVQLKIIEALLSGVGPEKHAPDTTLPPGRPAKSTPKKKTTTKTPNSDDPKAAKVQNKKPKTVILDLIGSGYFSTRRLIGDVQQHIKDSLSLTFSVANLQTTLNRLLANKTIQRAKNAENQQYEYWK